MAGHHSAKTQNLLPGIWEVARPLRDTSRWRRWRRERACRLTVGHCWHADSAWGWWCCECSADTEGMPERRCIHCDGGQP